MAIEIQKIWQNFPFHALITTEHDFNFTYTNASPLIQPVRRWSAIRSQYPLYDRHASNVLKKYKIELTNAMT